MATSLAATRELRISHATVTDRRYKLIWPSRRSIRLHGEKLKEFPAFDDIEIEKRLDRAEKAFARHRREPFPKRAQLLMAAASLLEQEKEKFARDHDIGDGQTVPRRDRGNREMRARLPIIMPKMPSDISKMNRRRPTLREVMLHYNRSVRCSRSCRGIFRSGRSSVSPRRR